MPFLIVAQGNWRVFNNGKRETGTQYSIIPIISAVFSRIVSDATRSRGVFRIAELPSPALVTPISRVSASGPLMAKNARDDAAKTALW
jgi:hypothetical protein